MAANPYIAQYDPLTTSQELEMWKEARARLTQYQMHQMNIGGGTRMLTRSNLREVNETIAALEKKLSAEEAATSGTGGAQNLVQFVRPL